MVRLYWDVGRRILEKQEREGWGARIVDRLAADLQRAFPGIQGFSRANIHRMRAFYSAWASSEAIVARAVRQLSPHSLQPGERTKKGSVAQPVRQSGTGIPQDGGGVAHPDDANPSIPPHVVTELPWGQNITLFEQVKDSAERLWYAHMAVEHGWSRPVLQIQIESNLFRRQGKAATNFKATLPPPQSDLAQQALRDPYVFDFLTMRDDANERALERGLLAHVERFLLELGAGFALVGRQVHLEVGGDDFYVDLLFYHLKLRCYIVIDLKTRAFVPEYAGKMNFYLSAVDDLLRQPGDQPSIGLILCKTRNKVVAEYALRDIRKPVGVSGYVTRLVESLPKPLQNAVPSVAEIERELAQNEAGLARAKAQGARKSGGRRMPARTTGRGRRR